MKKRLDWDPWMGAWFVTIIRDDGSVCGQRHPTAKDRQDFGLPPAK